MKYIAAAAMFMLLCADISAHGVEVYDMTSAMNDSIRIVHFVYSTGEPMSYSKIKLYPPSSHDTEILQSLCDKDGYFCFIADEAGEWLVVTEDGMGHKGEITIMANNISAGNAGAPSASASGGIKNTPLVLRCILGLSLIINIFALYFFMITRKKAAGVNPKYAGTKNDYTREARDAH